MGAEIVKTLLECLKLGPRYFLALGIVCGVLLYADAQLLQQLGIAQFAQDYRPVIGLTLLASVVLLVVAISSTGATLVGQWWRQRQLYRRMAKRMQALTEDEKQILRFYIAKQTRSNVLRFDDGIVQGLVAAGIIFRSAAQGSLVEGFAHNLSEFAWEYLNEKQEVLDGRTNTYRTDRRTSDWPI